MPIYEYACADCGAKLEIMQPIDANAKDLTCRACGGQTLKRLFSVPYVTKAECAGREFPGGCGCCGGHCG